MNEMNEEQGSGRGRRWWRSAAAMGAGALAAVVGVGLAASAVAADPTASPTAESSTETTQPDTAQPDGGGPAFRGGHMHGLLGGGIRGEAVVPDGEGGYRTVAVQRGTVTSVSADAITVESEDGFSQSYAVTEDTLVNAGREGIGDIEADDTVTVRAVEEDGNLIAAGITNRSDLERSRERFGMGGHGGFGGGPGRMLEEEQQSDSDAQSSTYRT